MLKIFLSLATFAAVVWLPILIYVFIDKNKSSKRRITPRKAASISYHRFGKGSKYNFDWYLRRESAVEVKSLQEICAWLMSCKYVHDQELFHHPDMWQHPVDFEIRQQGDCEDHALWAWRKLHDLGIRAEFVVGKIHREKGGWGDHSWIVLRNGSEPQVMETTAKQMDRFFVGASRAERMYRPFYGIDTQLRSYAYENKKNIS